MKGFIYILFLVILSHTVSAQTIVVAKTGAVKSIKRAIELAQPGDTILVKAGLYREGNIIIEKSIVLLGENFPVLDGENKVEILTVHAINTVISGFKFKDTGIASINDLAAIKLLDSKFIKIQNNQFENTFFGIYLANSSNVWIERNQLTSNAEAEHQI